MPDKNGHPADAALDGEHVSQLVILSYAVAHRDEPITVGRLSASLADPNDPAERAALHDAVDRLVEGELLHRQTHRNKDDAHLAPTKALLSLVHLFWGRALA